MRNRTESLILSDAELEAIVGGGEENEFVPIYSANTNRDVMPVTPSGSNTDRDVILVSPDGIW